MPINPSVVYLGCTLASTLCVVLLARGYARTQVRFLLWTSLCFLGLAANNLFLFLDDAMGLDLRPLRDLSTLFAQVTLLYGFIWERDRWP
jgi:hypothetical protein